MSLDEGPFYIAFSASGKTTEHMEIIDSKPFQTKHDAVIFIKDNIHWLKLARVITINVIHEFREEDHLV